jgi:cobalt-zinc-cadmium efflux system outer membrane protein
MTVGLEGAKASLVDPALPATPARATAAAPAAGPPGAALADSGSGGAVTLASAAIAAPSPTPAVTPTAALGPVPAVAPATAPSPAAAAALGPEVAASSGLTLAGVVQFAIDHHPLLRVRQYEVEAARARLITARLLPNPHLMFEVENPAAANAVGSGPPELVSRLMFTIPLGPKRELRTAVAQTDIYQTKLAMSREVKQVLAEAADAAVAVLDLEERVALYGRLAALAGEVVTVQKQRFEIAAVPYRNLVLVELSANRIELARQDTIAMLDQAKIRLARALGLSDGLPPAIEGQLSVEPVRFSPLPAVLARAAAVAPQLAQSRAIVQRSDQQLALEKWKAVPDVAVGPRLAGDLASPAPESLAARVEVDLPIFDRNQGHIAEAAADLHANSARNDLVQVATLNDVAAMYLELQDVQSRADYYRRHVRPLAGRTETALREAFQDRAITAYELNDLLESLARMDLDDLELRYQHQRLRTQLEILLECRLSQLDGAEAAAAPEIVPAPPGPLAPRPE